MPDQTLPERLRGLADDLEAHGADEAGPRAETCEALRGAADELERLAWPTPAPETLAGRLAELADAIEQGPQTSGEDAVDVRLLRDATDTLTELARYARRLEGEAHPEHVIAQARQTFVATSIAGGGAHFVPRPEHLFAAIALPAAEALRLVSGGDPMPGFAVELDALGRELAGDAGVPVPMPQPRRFAARYADPGTGKPYATPAPGSFVFAGPALAVWRVLGVERLEGDTRGTHALELEPVDAHDVPMLSRVDTVPLPVSELAGDAPGEAMPGAVLLCAATWALGPSEADGTAVCARVHGHDGEHLFRSEAHGFERAVDVPWDGPPRVVDAGSPEALEALEREGVA